MLQYFSANPTKNMLQMSLLSHSVICSSLLRINFNELKSLKKPDARIGKALELLNRNLSSLQSNETLAENIGMSVNGFIRLFMNEVGTTPQKYSRRKRIEKASILLHFTDKKIDEIANETGFLDRYHFSRAFKEITNYSPAEFRKRSISCRQY
jgi:transcriptional regulator GlxA family with amidase domain